MQNFAALLGVLAVTGVIFSYLSGVWALYGHFRTHGKIERGMKLTSLLSMAGILWFLAARYAHGALAGSAGVRRDALCLGLTLCFAALFWWAVATTRRRRLTLAFSKDQPSFLHMSGPYAWVRHPFYASYLLFWSAAAIGSASLAYWAVPAVMAAVYWNAVRTEEGKFAASGMADEYASYRARTGMFLPRLARRRMAGAAS